MFGKTLNIIVFSLGVGVFFSSCSDYQKVLKSKDLSYKYDRALQYFNEEEYYKAYPLMEELLAVYRGTGKAEKLSYLLAYADYHQRDYVLAAYRFKNFTKTYHSSTYAEECLFMSAYCYYLNSPRSSLDQTNTYQAMRELQLFINQYPQSSRIDSCNSIMDNLTGKLQKKAFDNSVLYYKTQYYLSAIISFNNLMEDYPDTKYREEAMYMIVKSNYKMAANSVEEKKPERLEGILKSYVKFVDKFPKSRFLREVEGMYESALKDKEKLLTKHTSS